MKNILTILFFIFFSLNIKGQSTYVVKTQVDHSDTLWIKKITYTYHIDSIQKYVPSQYLQQVNDSTQIVVYDTTWYYQKFRVIDTQVSDSDRINKPTLVSLGITDVGRKLATLNNPDAFSLIRINSDNDVVTRTLSEAKTDLQIDQVNNTSDANKPVSSATQTALNLKANLISPSFTTPVLGVATGTSLAVTSTITSSGGGIGYATGAGGAITQTGNRSTAVTINKLSGAITTVSTSLAAAAEATFTVNNNTVSIGDVVLLSARSGQTTNTSIPFVTAVANGSFSITLSNFNASTADTGAMIINFIVLKGTSN